MLVVDLLQKLLQAQIGAVSPSLANVKEVWLNDWLRGLTHGGKPPSAQAKLYND
ncbi:hypothetical protein NON20_07790 [Synechocystis sp. B12]|nr:hypothetical protein NON20_07790 [Synechocystis sp. B12]